MVALPDVIVRTTVVSAPAPVSQGCRRGGRLTIVLGLISDDSLCRRRGGLLRHVNRERKKELFSAV